VTAKNLAAGFEFFFRFWFVRLECWRTPAGTHSGIHLATRVRPSRLDAYHFGWTLALLAFVAGCSSDNPLGRREVQGTVTFRGQPLKQGSILFTPQDLQTGVSGGAVITDGAFLVPEAQGLPPGVYKISISSAGDTKAAASDQPPGASGQLAVELIPAEWNIDGKHTVEITEDSDTHLKFEIK
jgi:hypothetical protein